MFEKYTEKAINVVGQSQVIAVSLNAKKMMPEHLLLALIQEAKGISLKIFKSYDITYEKIEESLNITNNDNSNVTSLSFDEDYKTILKNILDLAEKSGNPTVLYEHIFLAVISDETSNNVKILSDLGFDIYKSKSLLEKLVQKKTKKMYHPEIDDNKNDSDSNRSHIENIFDSEPSTKVFDRAVAKLSASNYEILGTEQILSSILEDENSELAQIMNSYGIKSDSFEEKLTKIQSRQSEFEGKKIIFTPNAFTVMNSALQTAKELGSSIVLPEHIVLGILKTKKGIAYDIFKEFKINSDDLAHSIIKPIEKQMPETLTILRFAKREARRLGRNIVGTEMFLLGILGEGASDGAIVLNNLEINIRDARKVVENLIGFGDEYFEKEIVFTKRAKKVLEQAWIFAKKANKQKISSADMLLAITTEPESLAMKALEQLGVDAVEIKEGIKIQA
ncbi:MAG: Clp protease N-terminal domain-containing protein [Candidatus Gastranaerophilales bacterium]